MIAQYDKVIVMSEDDEKKVVVIFDEKSHLPTFYKLERCGMDQILEITNSDNGIVPR